MIDAEGFRANVGILICNRKGQVFWARRFGQHSWQYPQGGVNQGETPEQAMYRELYEEVGLRPEHVEILATSRHWLRYKLPKRLIRQGNDPVCIGQKQKWFLLLLTAPDQAVDLAACNHPEFDLWRWVSYWYPVRQVVSFKRDVYRRAMKEFAPVVMGLAGQKAAGANRSSQGNSNSSGRRRRSGGGRSRRGRSEGGGQKSRAG